MIRQRIRRLFRLVIASGTSVSFVLAPAIANAQQAAPNIVIDNRTDPAAPAPTLDKTANGIDQINIATPNSAGLSHNLFTNYNVQQNGLILNNATKATQTQIGGYVYGNANLQGKAAGVILNEVTGSQASQLKGFTEVAGQKANVVVANPNGITCSGCGFINTSRVTMATGHPEINAAGQLAALTVTDGIVAFEGQGGNFTAVPVLDILSRRVTLNAQVNAQNARIVVGRNRVDYQTGAVQKLASDGSQAPEFAIDSSAIGGMYAGQISMIVNETGAGVRVNGTMAANAGDMNLTSDGRLVMNGSMAASGAVAVQAGGITNSGTIQSGSDMALTSSADATNSGTAGAGQALHVSGISVANSGTLTASGSAGVSITSSAALSNSGRIGATQGGISVRAGSVTTTTGSTLASSGNMTVQTNGSFSHAGQLSSSDGVLDLQAGNVTIAGGTIASSGALKASSSSWSASEGSILKSGGNLSLAVTGPVSNAGVISAATGMILTASGTLTNTASGSVTVQAGPAVITVTGTSLENAGQIGTAYAGDLTVAANSLTNSGTLYGAGAGTVTVAEALNSSGGQIGSGTGALSLTAHDIANMSGKIISGAGPLVLTANGIGNSNGVIQAAGNVTLSAASLDNRAGGTVLSTDGSLTLMHGQVPMDSVLNQGGTLGSAGSLSLNTADYASDATSALASSGVLTLVMDGVLDNAGQLIGAQGFALTLGGLKNESSGLLAARTGNGSLTVTGTGGITNAGTIETLTSGSLLTVESAGGLTNRGLLTGTGSVALTVASAITNSGTLSAQGGNLSLKTDTLVNTGSVAALSEMMIAAGSSLSNDQDGQIAVQSGALNLTTGGTLSNAGQIGTIDAGDLTLTAANLTNTGMIGIAGSGAVTTGGSLDNSGSLKAAGSALTVQAQDLTVSGTLAATAGDLSVNAAGALTNSGTIYGAGAGALQVSSGLDNNGGQIGSGSGNLIISADEIGNVSGKIISSSGAVSLTSGQGVDNRTGTIQGQGDVTLSAGSLDNRSGGTILSQDGALTLSDGTGPMSSILNQGGALGAAGNLSLNTDSYESDATSSLISTGVLTLAMTGLLANEGRLVGQKGFVITAGSFSNGTDGVLAAVTGNGTLTTTGTGGVTNAGTIETLASGGLLTLRNTGSFSNSGSVLSGGATSLTASGDVTNSGKLSALGGDLNASTGSVDNSGTMAAAGNMFLSAAAGIMDSGTLYGANGLALTAANMVSVAGPSAQAGAGAGDVSVHADGLTVSDGQIIAAAGQLKVTAKTVLSNKGLLEGVTDLAITTDHLTNTNNGILLAGNGALSVAGLSAEAASSVANTGGTLQGKTGLSIRASSVDNTGGTMLSEAGELTLVSDSQISNDAGMIRSATGMVLTGGSYASDEASVISAGTNLVASFSGLVDNAGHMISAGNLDLTAGSLLTHSAEQTEKVSVIASTGGNLTVHSATVSNDGVLEATGANGTVHLTADTVSNSGTLSSAGDLTVSVSGGLTSSGNLLAQKGTATISAGSITNSGFAGAAKDITVASDETLTNSGTLFSGGQLTARSGGAFSNMNGRIGGTTIDLVTAEIFDNTAGSVIASAGNLAVTAGRITNGTGGVLQGNGAVTLTTDGLGNAGGTVLAKSGDLTLVSPDNAPGETDNSNGILQAGGAVVLPFSTLNNTAGTILALGNSLTLTGTDGSIVGNAGGTIESNGTLSLTAGRYTSQLLTRDAVSSASRMTAASDMILVLSGQAQNSGVIAAGRDLTIAADNVANDTGAVIASLGGNLALDLYGVDGLANAGTLQTTAKGAALTIGAQSLTNAATGGILSNGAQTLTVSGPLTNAGEITAYGSSLTVTAGSVANSNLLLAGADLTLSAPGTVTNTGLMYGTRNATLTVGQFDNRNGQTGVGDGALALVASSVDNSQNGRIIAKNGTTVVTSARIANDNGLIEAGSDLALYTTGLTNGGGKVISETGNVTLAGSSAGGSAGSIDNASGVLQARNSLTVVADTLSNRAGTLLTQNGDLLLNGPGGAALQSVDDTSGILQSGHDLALKTQVLTGAAGLSATRDLDFTLGTGLSDAMLFSAGRNVTLTLNGDYSIAAGSGVIAGGDATVNAASLANNGAMMAGGVLTVRTPGAISNTGLLDGSGGLTLALDGVLSNVQGAILSDAGSISVGGLSGVYAGDVVNRSGEIMAGSAAGDVVIHAASLTNDLLGGVTTTSGQVVYDKKYTIGEDGLANPPALNPSMANYGEINRYYNNVMKIYVPELWYSATGEKGTGYYIVALDGASASSYVEVTGTGSTATAANAAALIDAGRNLEIDTTGDILNDASHIAAGQNMLLTGASLTNQGYDTEITWTLTENSPHLKRWFTPSDGSQFVTPDPDAASNSASNPGWMVLNGGPHTAIWGSSTYTGLSGSIVAGGNLTGTFSGQIDNTTIVAHATPDLLASTGNWSGSTPESVSPSAQASAQSGGSLTTPNSSGSFVDASTAASSGTSGSDAVSGGGLNSQTGTTAAGQATSVSGGTLNGISAGTPQTVPSQTSGGATTSVPGSPSGEQPVYGHVLAPEGHENGTTTAQNLTLPGFSGAASASVSQVISSVPAGKALYVADTSPSATSLIETNPAYTSLTAFHGSEYLLDRLGDRPSDYTFLGDSTFDQQYVQQQIISATGQTFLGGTYTTAATQMQALLDNAVAASDQLGLKVGDALSAVQQSALTSDIVWYQNEVVDGKTVLVPKLYLAPGHEALTGATISGQNVSLTAASVTNSGSVSAKDALSITATSGNITNTGALSGGTVNLTAQNGSILNSDTITTYLVGGGTQGQLASVGSISATGSASLSAADDITFNGGVLTSGGDLSLLAGNGLTLGTTTVEQASSVSGKHLSISGSQTENYGTTITSGGNAVLAALTGDLKTAGTTLTTDGNLTLSAAKSLDLGSVTNSVSDSISGKESGFLTKSSFSLNTASTTEIGSAIAAGGTLTAVSGGDMSIKGTVGSAGDATLLSGGTFTESATKSTADESSSHHTAGVHISQNWLTGASSISYKSSTDTSAASATTWTPSIIASTDGNLTIASTGAMKIDASAVAAAADVALSGSSVVFSTEQNTLMQSGTHKDWSIGMNAGLSSDSIVGAAVNTAGDMIQKSGSGTQKALTGIQTGISEATSIAAGAQSGNLVGVSVSIGVSKNKSSSTETTGTVQGSTAAAGGTLTVAARGDDATDATNGDVRATAAALSGQNVVLSASKDISLSAGWDTTHSESKSASKSASVGANASVGTSGAGVSVSVGGSLSHTSTTSDSATAVDTTVTATNGVTIAAPGATVLNGAEVSGGNIVLNTGSLSITSPVNTASYEKESYGGSVGVTIPVWGAAMGGASASLNYEKITDKYQSTGESLSGLYAGSGGLDAVVSGDTVLTAGVISSTADAGQNRFSTGTLSASSLDDISKWDGIAFGFSASFGSSQSTTEGSFNGKASKGGSGGTVEVGVGVVSHHESGTSQSAIGGNINVEAGSVSGSYTTDVSSANGHLANNFDANSVEKTLQAEVGGTMVAEGAAEAVYQLAAGNEGKDDGKQSAESGADAGQNTVVDAVGGSGDGTAAGSAGTSGQKDNAVGSSGNGSVGNGGGSVASTVTYGAATGATDALGHHGQMQLDDHMTYTGSSADGTTDFYTVYGHRPAGTASSGQAVLSAGTGYTLPSQRFDYYGISSAGNQALLDLMFPPVSTAHSVYNTATAIAAGDYKGAAWEAAPLAAGAVGGVAASYVSKVAGKIIGSEGIRETIQKVAGALQTEEEVPAGPSGLCFVSGTPVLTPDGWRSIETLRPGDSVISRDETRRMTVVEHVVRLFHNHGRRIVDIALDGAGRHEVLGATPGHPFYVAGHGWTDAGKLHAGDRVESGTGETLRVRSVTARTGVSDTYNFEVEQTHTYFVGKLRAWVHNACVPSKADNVLTEIKQTGSAPAGYKGGRTFANDGRGGGQVLPKTDAQGNTISYQEFDVNPYTSGVNRGAERIVVGKDPSGNITGAYYTSDHYSTFTLMK